MTMRKFFFGIAVLLLMFSAAPMLAQEAAAQPEAGHWWNNRVFYEVFVRSFYDSNGDGTGDLQGLIQKLDYLNDGDPDTNTDLGITGLWLMPVMEAASYHGYDTIDYRQVEKDYGTNEDFKKLVAEAHKRGIAVIVDLVLNHTSDQSPWFIKSAAGDPKYKRWYIWSDTDPGYSGPFGEQVWFPKNNRYYYAVFSSEQPDLNFYNPAVTDELKSVGRFWLEEMGVDGFREDAAKHLIESGRKQENTGETRAWLKDWQNYLESINPNVLTVAEVMSSSNIVSPYVKNHHTNLAFDFDLAAAMLDSVRSGSADNVINTQEQSLDYFPPGQYAAFLTNHDQNRVMTSLGNDVDKAKIAASVLLTNPGVPFIYYGEEIGMQGAKPDERIRAPMQWDATPETGGFTTGTPWEALGDGADKANIASEAADPNSLLSHYRNLIRLRMVHPALREGDFTVVDSGDAKSVYAYLRHSSGETLLVVMNLSKTDVSHYTLKLAKGPLQGTPGAAVVFGKGQADAPTVNAAGGFEGYMPLPTLPAYSTTVIQLK
jgi:alpha-amylase